MTIKVDASADKAAIREVASRGETGDLKGHTVKDLNTRLNEIAKIKKTALYQNYQDLENTVPHLKDQITTAHRIIGTTILALMIIGIICCVLGPYFTRPQDFLLLFQNINYVKLGIGLGVPFVLMIGAGIVIYRTSAKREELLGEHHLNIVTKDGVTTVMRADEEIPENATVISSDRDDCQAPIRGSFDREHHIETVLVKCAFWKEGVTNDYYVDMSTVAESGKALMYHVKPCDNHYTISFVVPLLATLPHMIGTMVYHLLRAVIVPFYVLVQWLREQCDKDLQLFEERKFEFKDIFIESGKSLWRVVKAPFYALAYVAVYIASFWDPARRMQIAAIQRDWNEGVTFEEGFWLAPALYCKYGMAAQKFWKFEGGGSPDGLGRNGALIDACQQPTGYVIFNEEGKAVTAYRMEAALEPAAKERPLEVIFRKDLEKAIEGIEAELEQLDTEYDALKAELNRRNASNDAGCC